ncbi:AAA family ATPase [uncultured Granulicatella sp.]|uniref:AAA family ATPase n=1 Tax=uncultured Granulicatella sp. TaxID=316089 RepID=UPI0028DC69B4|nr:AAA family ATPase [uncultured Granulicatella sp.]
MPRFLVGTTEDTWNFDAAYEAAKDGDIIEFTPNLIMNFTKEPFTEITKNITIIGHVEGNTFLNTIKGKIKISNKAKVIFQNLWMSVLENVNMFHITGESEVTFENCVLQSEFPVNEHFLVFSEEKSKVHFKDFTTKFPDKHKLGMKFVHSVVSIQDSTIQNRLWIRENSELEFVRSKMECSRPTSLWIEDSKLSIISSVVYGTFEEGNQSVLTATKSELYLEDTIVDGVGTNYYTIFLQNGSGVFKNLTVSFMRIKKSHIRMVNGFIQNNIFIEEDSTLYSQGILRFLNKESKHIPITLTANSLFVGDSVEVEKEISTTIRAKEGSCFVVNDFIHLNGDATKLNYEIDETSQCRVTKKHKAAPERSEKGEIIRTEDAQKVQHTNTDYYAQLQGLIGLKTVKEKVDKLIQQAKYNQLQIEQGLPPEKMTMHAAFLGNPGTGKTTVARLMGQILFQYGALKGEEFKFVEVSAADLLSGYVNQTAEQTRKKLEEAKGGVLFIDEAYALNKKGSNSTGEEAINELLTYMENHRDDIMVIFAGYTKEMEQFFDVNPGFNSRVPHQLTFEDYSPDEIVQMGLKIFEGKARKVEDPEFYARKIKEAYKRSLDKSNARWIRNQNEQIMQEFIFRVMSQEGEDMTLIKNQDIEKALSQGSYEESDNKVDAWKQLNQLIGLEKVKEQVSAFINQVELSKVRQEQGIETKNITLHSLFLGNPGTGKTTVARIIGELLYQKGMIATNKMVEVSRGDLIGGYQGQTAIKTREHLQAALGGVLFIDEAYSLKHGPNDNFGQEAIDEILKFMEDHRHDMVVIFAGYHKEMSAFLETNSGLASRVPNTFDFEDYTSEEIAQIGLYELASDSLTVDEEAYRQVVATAYARTNDRSNGRWIRNFNEKLRLRLATRFGNNPSIDPNQIIQQDLEDVLEMSK